MNQYLIGILFGGSLITSLGALSTYTVENKQFEGTRQSPD